jgi:hypothetical protein
MNMILLRSNLTRSYEIRLISFRIWFIRGFQAKLISFRVMFMFSCEIIWYFSGHGVLRIMKHIWYFSGHSSRGIIRTSHICQEMVPAYSQDIVQEWFWNNFISLRTYFERNYEIHLIPLRPHSSYWKLLNPKIHCRNHRNLLLNKSWASANNFPS